MKTLRSLLVYLVALATIPLVFVAFANLYPPARGLMGATGLTIAPHITGGPVATRITGLALTLGVSRKRRNSLIQSPPPAWRMSALRQPSACTWMSPTITSIPKCASRPTTWCSC